METGRVLSSQTCAPHAGSGTGGSSSGLPLDTDPKDAANTDRIDDPEQLFQRRRAKDPIAFDQVHGKKSTLYAETDGLVQGKFLFLNACMLHAGMSKSCLEACD